MRKKLFASCAAGKERHQQSYKQDPAGCPLRPPSHFRLFNVLGRHGPKGGPKCSGFPEASIFLIGRGNRPPLATRRSHPHPFSAPNP